MNSLVTAFLHLQCLRARIIRDSTTTKIMQCNSQVEIRVFVEVILNIKSEGITAFADQ